MAKRCTVLSLVDKWSVKYSNDADRLIRMTRQASGSETKWAGITMSEDFAIFLNLMQDHVFRKIFKRKVFFARSFQTFSEVF